MRVRVGHLGLEDAAVLVCVGDAPRGGIALAGAVVTSNDIRVLPGGLTPAEAAAIAIAITSRGDEIVCDEDDLDLYAGRREGVLVRAADPEGE